MSWMMPETWADDFDPPTAGWKAYHGPVRDLFPGVVERGWGRAPMMRQRDFWTRETDGKTHTLVVEWASPWSEVIAVIVNGVVITDMPESREEFDTFWKIRMER